jgi:hypothetical protein
MSLIESKAALQQQFRSQPMNLTVPLVPKERPKIAPRFNAGWCGEKSQVPKGRLNSLLSSLRDLATSRFNPALKRRAIFQCPFGTDRRDISAPRMRRTSQVSLRTIHKGRVDGPSGANFRIFAA